MKEVKLNTFEEAIETIEEKLRKFIEKDDTSTKDQWLQTLYNNYHKRFLADNSQVWGNGRILVPVSLTAFGVYAGLETPTLHAALFLAFASISLIMLWLVNAEKHRAFQNKSMAWLVAIEKAIGLKDVVAPYLPDDAVNRFISRRGIVKWGIRSFSLAIPLAWLAIILWVKH